MLRDTVLAAKTLHKFTVPSWGCELLLRPFTLREMTEFEAKSAELKENKDPYFFAKTVASCLVEDDGTLCFPDYTDLLDREFQALYEIFQEIVSLNSAKAQDAAKKN